MRETTADERARGDQMLRETLGEMVPDLVQDITDFRRRFPWDGEFYEGGPRMLPLDQFIFWMDFIKEEKDEWKLAHSTLVSELGMEHPQPEIIEKALADMLDAGVDIIYVVMGVLQRQGLLPKFYSAWNRVHGANMKKECANGDASKSARGNPWDVIKPPGWEPASLVDLVSDHIYSTKD